MAGTMLWLAATHPVEHPAHTEAVNFILAPSTIGTMVILTNRFNVLCSRLKAQKAELETQKTGLGNALLLVQSVLNCDDLTMLPNRRHMNVLLALEQTRNCSFYGSMCIAVIDIDIIPIGNVRHAGGSPDPFGTAERTRSVCLS